MATEQAVAFTLVLNDEERGALLRLLEQSLVDTHAESRRTEAPGYQAAVHHQEYLLRTLVEKVRRLGP